MSASRPDPSAELVDVLDEAGRAVDVATRAAMRAANLRHGAVYVVVLSSTGSVLVHRRSGAKDLWPGRWDLAAGGVPASGESHDAAARRELAEELGIDAEPTRLGTGAYRDADVDVVGTVYVTRHDGPFRFTDDEVVEARFVDRAGLDALVATAPFVPDSLAFVLPLVEGLIATEAGGAPTR